MAATFLTVVGSWLPGAELPPTALPSTGASASEDGFQPQELEGEDAKVAMLAAHRLLQQIALAATTQNSELHERLRSYLSAKLDAESLARPGANTAVAERVVDAMATRIAAGGPPLSDTQNVLLPLVGVGSVSLRSNVVRALQGMVRYESSGGRPSPTGTALAGQFRAVLPPTETVVADTAEILWADQGKILLAALVELVVARRDAKPGSATYPAAAAALHELRTRIPRSFEGIDGWSQWWEESKDLPLNEILFSCYRRNESDAATTWKAMIRRLRETGDAERLLLALQDTLTTSPTLNLRVGAVVALGDFATWVAEMQPQQEGDAATKDKLLRRAVDTLWPLLQRRGLYVEGASVTHAALGSLLKYHQFLEKNEDAAKAVSAVVLAKLAELAPGLSRNGRQDLLEGLRLAGVLRMEGARPYVEKLLNGGEGDSPEGASRWASDLELQTVAATTLGRLGERSGLGQEEASLLIRVFRRLGTGSDKAARDLRRACVTALGSGEAPEDVRAVLVSFHRGLLLGESDKDLRIPAILALGMLARQGETGALETLLQVVAAEDTFEPQEVIAAIDSVAYVGGEAALQGFLKHVVNRKDKQVQAHLLKKISALVVTGGVGVLASTLQQLEDLALATGTISFLEFAGTLWGDPPVQQLVTAATQAVGSAERVGALWTATLEYACIQDLLGADKTVVTTLDVMNDLLQKDPAIKTSVPKESQRYDSFRAHLAKREEIRQAIGSGQAGVEPSGTAKSPEWIVEALRALVQEVSRPVERWGALRWASRVLEGGLPSERVALVLEGWVKLLRADEGSPIWEGFPTALRDRYRARLDELRAKAPAILPGTIPPPGESPPAESAPSTSG